MTLKCSICSVLRKTEETPSSWCLECDQALCSSCEQHHSLSTASSDHNTVLFENYQKLPDFVRNLKFNCEEHGEKYQYYCRNDDKPICRTCKAKNHKKCPDTPDIEKVIQNVKSSFVLEETHANLKKVHKIILNAVEDRKQNLTSLQSQRSKLLADIVNTKEKIIERLDEWERNAKSDVDKTYSVVEKEISNILKTLVSTEQSMHEIINRYNEMKMNATNLQTFIDIKEIELNVQNASTYLTQLSANGEFWHTSLTCALDDDTVGIFSRLKSLGYVEKLKSKPVILLDMNEVNTGQYEKVETVKLHKQVDIVLDEGFYEGCCTLSSGLIVVADSNIAGIPNLKIMNEDGSMKCRFDMSENGAFDVTDVDDNHVAVSGRGKSTSIFLINVADGSVTKTYKTYDGASGLSHIDGNILFCAVNKGIKELNLKNGNINDVIHDDTVYYNSYISTGNDRICYTCPDTYTVNMLDTQFNLLFKFKGKKILRNPYGITIDDRMNVYVADFGLDNVVVLSPDGKTCNKVLNRDDGLSGPTALHYDRHTKKLVVVAKCLSKIEVYDVS